MKIGLPNFSTQKGFTLIELLVVIGILGILAAALLQTIDPFEQLKKGRDTVKRNTALEVLNASTRYYATHGYLPWNASGTVPNCVAINPSGTALNAVGMVDCINELINDGELKEGFLEAITQNGDAGRLFITTNADEDAVTVCYAPESRSFRNDPKTNRDATDQADQNCPDADSANCYQCYK